MSRALRGLQIAANAAADRVRKARIALDKAEQEYRDAHYLVCVQQDSEARRLEERAAPETEQERAARGAFAPDMP